MSRQQTLPFIEDTSTCSRADFLASRSASQAKEKARMITVTSGQRCCEQLEKLNHVGLWVKMFSGLLIGRTEWYSSRCNLIWRMKGMKCNRILFQLAPSMRPIVETECGLLPTVVTQGLKYCNEKGQSAFVNPQFLSTPNAAEATHYTKKWNPTSQMGTSLTAMAVNHLLPTCLAQDSRHALHDRGRGKLGEQIAETFGDGTSQNSQLNPLFVAEMMGFPTDWTLAPFLDGLKSINDGDSAAGGAENPSKPTVTP